MTTLSTTDHTIGFNMGGTWVELATFADEFGVGIDEVEDALSDMDLDWIGEDLTDRAEALLREELIDVFGEDDKWVGPGIFRWNVAAKF